MAQQAGSAMYMAIVVEETVSGFHRETLWYGGDPENLASMIIDVMKDWYEPNKEKLNPAIIRYHKMLENKEKLTFDKLAKEGFKVDGKELRVQMTSNLMQIFAFVMGEICDIFGKRGEKIEDFHSLAEFRKHFLTYYDLDDNLKAALEGVNPAALSRALVSIDIKYNYTGRHFQSGSEK